MIQKKFGKIENVDLLRLMEQRMIAIELAGEGIGIIDTRGCLDFANKALADMYGYQSWRDMVGLDWRSLTTPEEKEKIEVEVVPTLQVQKSWSGQSVGLRRDGQKFYNAITISGLPDGRWIFLVRDISDQILLQEIARNRLAAMEAAGDGIGLVDADGNLTYMNRALKALHEFDEGDEKNYIGHQWVNLYTEQGKHHIQTVVMPELRSNRYWKGESPILTKTGRVVYTEMSLTLLEDGGMIGTARDITGRVKAEQEKSALNSNSIRPRRWRLSADWSGGLHMILTIFSRR